MVDDDSTRLDPGLFPRADLTKGARAYVVNRETALVVNDDGSSASRRAA